MLASLSKLAELSGYDRRTVSAKLADVPSRPGPKNSKLFEASVAMRVLFGSATGSGGEGPLDAQQEKAMLDKARRTEIEQRLAIQSGRLLEADVVAAEWINQVQIAKGRLLALPSRIAPAVIGLGDLRAIELVIRDAVYEALTELSADPEETQP